MTNVEAVKSIVARIDTCFLNDEPFPEDLSLAIKAIEKQMPKKVKGKYPFYCPSCGTKVSPGPYCWKCGQRVEFERREVKV